SSSRCGWASRRRSRRSPSGSSSTRRCASTSTPPRAGRPRRSRTPPRPAARGPPERIRGLALTGAVDSVDLKGAYRGTVVDNPADPVLYRRVAEGFTEAWIEAPDLESPEGAQRAGD